MELDPPLCEELSLAPPKPVSVVIDGVTAVWVGQVGPQTSGELSQWDDSEGLLRKRRGQVTGLLIRCTHSEYQTLG